MGDSCGRARVKGQLYFKHAAFRRDVWGIILSAPGPPRAHAVRGSREFPHTGRGEKEKERKKKEEVHPSSFLRVSLKERWRFSALRCLTNEYLCQSISFSKLFPLHNLLVLKGRRVGAWRKKKKIKACEGFSNKNLNILSRLSSVRYGAGLSSILKKSDNISANSPYWKCKKLMDCTLRSLLENLQSAKALL